MSFQSPFGKWGCSGQRQNVFSGVVPLSFHATSNNIFTNHCSCPHKFQALSQPTQAGAPKLKKPGVVWMREIFSDPEQFVFHTLFSARCTTNKHRFCLELTLLTCVNCLHCFFFNTRNTQEIDLFLTLFSLAQARKPYLLSLRKKGMGNILKV